MWSTSPRRVSWMQILPQFAEPQEVLRGRRRYSQLTEEYLGFLGLK